jgi:hypothetical protein
VPTLSYGKRLCGLHAGDLLIEGLPQDYEEVVVDLRSAEFADPSGLVSLTTACLEAIGMGNNLAVVGPADQNVANYLLRMRFRDLLRGAGVRFAGGFGSGHVAARPLSDHLLELQFVTRTNATAVGESLMSLGDAVGIPHDVLVPAFLGLGEGVDNTLEHSGADRAIVMAQRYRLGSAGFRLQIAIGDIGLGLRRTLRRRVAVADDAEAVDLAVKKGVSRFAGSRHGNGLPDVVQAVCEDAGGTFEIRSGDASLKIRRSIERQEHAISRDGVQIAISFAGGLKAG